MSRPDEARSDARDESLDATDVDPTGNAVANDATSAKDRAAQDRTAREHEGDEEEASPT